MLVKSPEGWIVELQFIPAECFEVRTVHRRLAREQLREMGL